MYEDVRPGNHRRETFDLEENACYYKSYYTRSASKPKDTQRNSSNKCLLGVMISVVIVLLLGTVGACVAFALEISTLRSQIASLQMEMNNSLEETQTQRQVTDAIQQLNATTEARFQQLNATTDVRFQQLSIASEAIRQEFNNALDGSTQN